MQVAIITIGTRGDIQPYIALGQGLQAAGYEVKVVTFQAFESLVRGSGLDFAAVSGDLASLMTMDWTQSQIESGGKSMGSLGSIAQDAEGLLVQLMTDCLQACQGLRLLWDQSLVGWRDKRWHRSWGAVLFSISSAIGSDKRLSEFVLAVPDAATLALCREAGVQLDDPCVLSTIVLAPVWQGAQQGAAEGVAPASFLAEAALSSALWV